MIPEPAMDRGLETGHPLLIARYIPLRRNLEQRLGTTLWTSEVYRSNERQQWLYGAGRTALECQMAGVPAELARPGAARVTNAHSAASSAHGWMVKGAPASAAIDVVPLGLDGKPWTEDDRWDDFLATLAAWGPGVGLVHFTKRGLITDRPHLQLAEWSDLDHTVHL